MDERIELGEFDLDAFMQQADVPDIEQRKAEKNYRIVLAIDASSSMRGHKIGAANDVANNIVSKLKSFSRGQVCNIQIAAIGFSTKLFRWTNGFVPVKDFSYSYVEMVDGKTDINGLFDELVRIAPVEDLDTCQDCVVLFSDGLPTEDYEESLRRWRACPSYQKTIRIVVSFDDDLADPQSNFFFDEFADGGNVISIKDQDSIIAQMLA